MPPPQITWGTQQGVSFQSYRDAILSPSWFTCSDILTVKSATLLEALEAIVFILCIFSGKFMFVLGREVPHQPYPPLPLPSHIGFVYEVHSLLFRRQKILCISDIEQPGFFQEKNQGSN